MNTKLLAVTVSMLLLATIVATTGLSVDAKPERLQPGIDFSGPHFNLIVHGVPDGVDKFKNDSIGEGRHTMFVPLNSTEQSITIEFAVSDELNWTMVDCDATGDGYASLILPRYMYIDTDGDGIEDTPKKVDLYKVFVVGLGKPGDNEIILYPTATFTNETGTDYYYWDDFTLDGHKNKPHGGKPTGQPDWQNVTDLFIVDAMTIWNDTNNDGNIDMEWIDTNDNGIMDAGEWVDSNGDFIIDLDTEWTDSFPYNGYLDAGEWYDLDNNTIIDLANEWTDNITINGILDAGEWHDYNNDTMIDVELIYYENEWVFNIEYLEDYWWDVKNDGVQLMQIRFYPVFANGNGNNGNGASGR